MPTISRFYGIVIRMFYNDHNPPHFHAVYGDYEAVYQIDPLRKVQGKLPKRAHALVMEWAGIYTDELMDDWEAAAARESLSPIPPLK